MIPLAQLIAAEAAQPLEASGYDWWQVSLAEEEVFRIHLDRVSLMVAAWGAYEAFHDKTGGAKWDMEYQPSIDAAKAEKPHLAAETYGQTSWSNFAVTFSDLTMAEAWQWWMKTEAGYAREGLLSWKDGSMIY